jgi:hypothetical protein
MAAEVATTGAATIIVAWRVTAPSFSETPAYFCACADWAWAFDLLRFLALLVPLRLTFPPVPPPRARPRRASAVGVPEGLLRWPEGPNRWPEGLLRWPEGPLRWPGAGVGVAGVDLEAEVSRSHAIYRSARVADYSAAEAYVVESVSSATYASAAE